MQPEIIKLIKKYACHSEAKENSTGNNAYILLYKKRFSVHIVLEKKNKTTNHHHLNDQNIMNVCYIC